MTPHIAVGSLERVTPQDFTRPCYQCGRTVYMRDQQAYDIGRASCLECLITWMETTEAEQVALILPPGWTKAQFMAVLRGGSPTVQ